MVHIRDIAISLIPPITDEISLDFDERVNLFIGPNACGKSTILRLIEFVHLTNRGDTIDQVPPPYPAFRPNPYDVHRESPICRLKTSIDWPRNNEGLAWNAVPLVYIPSTRVSLPPSFPVKILEDGPLPAIVNNPWEDLVNHSSTGVFFGHLVDWTIELAPTELAMNRRKQIQVAQAVQLGYSCSKRICSEVIAGNAPHPIVESDDLTGGEVERIVHNRMGIVTSDDVVGEPLFAGALSSGTQGTLMWVWALAFQMANHYSWTDGWDKRPAILLIDEIENHLHPTWQRRVIPALLEHFPGLQIFATTHSPFVVAGLRAGQVHLLERDDEGRVTATTNTEDVIGWTADEILRNMMGVDDPTDDVTAAAARELRELRNSTPENSEEAEAERQLRMHELRQLVDRDLLAGGPLAAQRELFEEHLAEALKEYRHSQSLNQENG